jgi:cytochrome c oxidase cbb3-type subunit I/II
MSQNVSAQESILLERDPRGGASRVETFKYDNHVVRAFAIATIVWGLVGTLVGLLAGCQLFWGAKYYDLLEFARGLHLSKLVEWLGPTLNFNTPFATFGRIRPLHTNAVIFAFVGNGMFCGIYYSLQRLCKARMFSDILSWLNFWGWQAIIVSAAITLPMGFTSSKEYAELEWPIDIAIAVIWVAFTVNLLGTILKRREKHMYVAIWFYISTALTVAMLHIVNSLEVPAGAFKSYSVYAGVQDALVQWWYGHNAVAFFLTTPYLGLMYYFLPKAANRPVFSYRLSIIHFWGLIFLYIWAGPHHLLYTALPDWAQSLGMVFSVMLVAPSWGGMLNGLLTLRGAWDKVRQEPMLKFMVVAITAYGMATLEGPTLAIKSVNALSHYTNWTIAHVHTGALGWNGFLTFSMLYWLFPRLYNTKLWSTKLANYHFWVGLLGMMFYVVPMYVAGITQGLMWKQFTKDGFLQYPNFLETVIRIVPMYELRALGGTLYIIGLVLMVINLYKTAKVGRFIGDETVQAPALNVTRTKESPKLGHRWLEGVPVTFSVLAVIAVIVGGLIEIVPMFLIQQNVPTIASVHPYTPLEVLGRDIYIREGCLGCHSQMIRPFRSETERYGEYSKVGEFVYDHPFLWGSERTGPDLHRIGGKYPDAWHYNHMENPRATSPGSIMPGYPWMLSDKLDVSVIGDRMRALRKVGVPYTNEQIEGAPKSIEAQAKKIVANLATGSITNAPPDREIIALIAYLQRLGTDIKAAPAATNATTQVSSR